MTVTLAAWAIELRPLSLSLSCLRRDGSAGGFYLRPSGLPLREHGHEQHRQGTSRWAMGMELTTG